jgi:hypothetical protein
MVLMLVLDDVEGSVPASLTGQVLDANRRAIPRAVVTASAFGGVMMAPSTTLADDQGEFRIDVSRNVPYIVSAFTDGRYGVAVSPIANQGPRVPVTVLVTALER